MGKTPAGTELLESMKISYRYHIHMLLFLVLLAPLSAEKAYDLPDKYRVVFTKVSGDEAFEKRWTKLLMTNIAVVREHQLAEAELAAMDQNARLAKKQSWVEALSKVQLEMAQIQLKKGSSETGRYYKLFLEHESLKKKIDKLESVKKLKADGVLPIEYDQVSEIYYDDLAYFSPENYLWLYGRAAVVRPGVYYLEYFAYNSLTNKRETLIQETFENRNMVSVAKKASRRLTGLLLGRAWGGLSVTSTIVSSEYFLDGYEVSDPRLLEILKPGKYELVVKSPGYETETREVEIREQRILRLNFSPKVLPESSRRIESIPAGAEVFLDGEYKGKTPLNIVAGHNQILYLNQEGHHPIFFTMNQEKELMFKLYKNDFDPQKEVENAQKWFYASLGVFVASLIVPITMYSIQRNYIDKAENLEFRGDMAGGQMARQQASTYGIAFWSSAGVSAGLMGWSIYQLVHYVRTSAK
ncbi:MAG: PEGA domain-containing protein [Spirochaetia bacterium]